MPYFFTIEILYYVIFLLLLITVVCVGKGASAIRLFEKKHLKRLKFVTYLVYIGFAVVTVIGTVGFFRAGFQDVYSYFGVEWIILFFTTVIVALGIAKIKNTLIHGKKYKSAFFYFGIAALLMLVLIIYLFLEKNGSFIF